MQDRPRRTMSSRDAAEAMFKAATKPAEAPLPVLKKPAVPGAKEQVSLRLDREVPDYFGRAGQGWQTASTKRCAKSAGAKPAQTPRARHSALMLAARTTLPHLSVSGEEGREPAELPVIAVRCPCSRAAL